MKHSTTQKRQRKTKDYTRKRQRHRHRDRHRHASDNAGAGAGTGADDGWLRITIRGAPYERGVSHGKQVIAADPERFTYMFSVYDFLFKQGYGRDIDFFYGLCDDFYRPIIKKRFPKIFKEMEGIAAGAGIRVCQVILINVYMSLPYFYAHLLRYIDTPKYR